jgi:predicted RNase H-like HicB family nuclease
MKSDYYTFPAFLYYDSDGISIEFPDLPGCLPCAKTTEEAFRNAREALGLHLFGMEQDGDPIPEPTPVNELSPEDGAVVAMFDVFMPTVREKMNNRVVKKTLTIPAWLNAVATEQNINFSQTLQDALRSRLGV